MLPYGSIGKKQINEHSVNTVFINIFCIQPISTFYLPKKIKEQNIKAVEESMRNAVMCLMMCKR